NLHISIGNRRSLKAELFVKPMSILRHTHLPIYPYRCGYLTPDFLSSLVGRFSTRGGRTHDGDEMFTTHVVRQRMPTRTRIVDVKLFPHFVSCWFPADYTLCAFHVG